MHRAALRLGLAAILLAAIALPSSATVWVLTANLSGSQVVPPTNSPAIGQAIMSYDDVSKLFNLAVYEFGLTQSEILSAKIYVGAPGTNGPAIYDLDGGASWSGSGVIYSRFVFGGLFPAAHQANLLSGNTYIQINTPGGVKDIRGQLIPVPEPMSLIGLSAGLGLLLLRRRKV
ncbi:MAG: CHRD domain-containing protein [Armatimonadota bacterium]|nr:CHRD domain-containing protein [bacterium]MDW8321708.1 CHRD domain-containing protein [Armatimonadota bacterium]